MTRADSIPQTWHELTEPIVIALPWVKPPLTLNQRNHWRVEARIKSEAKQLARYVVRAAKVTPVAGAVVILHYHPGDNRRRDVDNLGPTLKVCLDALVAEGVLPDDSWVHVPRAYAVIHPKTQPAPCAMALELRPLQEVRKP